MKGIKQIPQLINQNNILYCNLNHLWASRTYKHTQTYYLFILYHLCKVFLTSDSTARIWILSQWEIAEWLRSHDTFTVGRHTVRHLAEVNKKVANVFTVVDGKFPPCTEATMSSVLCLRQFVNERLTAAAEEIVNVFEKTIADYEKEITRQRRLLSVVWKPQVKIHRAGS